MKKLIAMPAVLMAGIMLMPNATSASEIIIKAGDTLFSLAKEHNTTVNELKAMNNLIDDKIVVGQKLIVSQTRKGTVINAEYLNVRTGPSMDYGVRMVIPGGTEVQIVKEEKSWYLIRSGNQEGYVSSYYIGEKKEEEKVEKLPTRIQLTQTSALFEEPGKKKVTTITPQFIQILERGNDGWLKIQTWLGPLWIKDGVTVGTDDVPARVYLASTSAMFKQPGKEKVTTINAQYVQVVEYGNDGWMKINSWLGALWVKEGVTKGTDEFPIRLYLGQTSDLFKQQGKERLATINPQYIEVLGYGTDGWMKINSWLGEVWVKNGVREVAPAPVPTPPKPTPPPVPTPTPPVTAPGETIIHTVVAGENLTRIANQYNTSVEKIMNDNNIKSANVIHIGQKLTITKTAPVVQDPALKIFIKPIVGNVVVTSNYGPRWGTIHYGTDFSKGGDAEIIAAADGVVSRSEMHYSYGEVVYIKHVINGKNYETLYAHMKEGTRAVQKGDIVKAGQFLGWMGSTGHSTGPHLHFEVHIGEYRYGQGTSVDPLLYIK